MKYHSQKEVENAKKHKIMIVEDEVLVAGDLQEILENYGYEVVGIATTGEDAIVLAGETRPDLIFMDIKLEGQMDGTEAAQTIYHSFNIPVIFITAYSGGTVLEKAKNSNPFGYLVKPFDERELHPMITMALNKYERETKIKKERNYYKNLFEENQVEVILRYNPSTKNLITGKETVSPDILDNCSRIIKNEFLKEEKSISPPDSDIKTEISDSSINILQDKYIPRYGMKAASQKTGLESNQIRQYERQGLIKPYRDPESNYRQFTEDEIEWLIRIKKLINEAGFNIKGILTILTLESCWDVIKCNPSVKERCQASQDRDYPCWYHSSELIPRQNNACYKCEYYINARQHEKLQI